MGKHKRSAARALDWLAGRCEVAALVCPDPDPLARDEQRLDLVARRHGIAWRSDDELYADPPEVDLVLSFLFWKRIRRPLIELPRVGCLNFHPAPLPDMRGLGGYNVAILEGFDEWGVSAHFVDEDFDTGDLIAVERFGIDPEGETALSLDLRSQEALLTLFRQVVGAALDGEELPRRPQAAGAGRYVTREEFESLRMVRPGDDLGRKLRAFWYPPWPGAVLEVDGRELTLVDEGLLEEVAERYREAGAIP
jgi:methionyl-tRNA formyltransferase